MKKIVVYIPPKFDLSDEDIDALTLKYEEIAFNTGRIIGEYVEVYYDFNYLSKDYVKYDDGINEETRPRYFFADCVLDMRDADCVVFADNWQKCEECRLLHSIAETFGVRIIDYNRIFSPVQ